MSVDLYALCTTELPNGPVWHTAITKQNYPLIMNERFDPTKDSGYWPAKLRGKDTGFEYYAPLRAEWEQLPNLDQPSRFRSGIQLTTHANLTEFVASILAAVALARACGGVVYEAQEGKTYEGVAMEQLLNQVKLAERLDVRTAGPHR